MSLIIIPAFAFLLCTILHLCALKLFPRWGLLDFPGRYGERRQRLPYPTGILAILTFLLIYLSLGPLNLQAQGLIIAIVVLGTISFLDDRLPLPASHRLFLQILSALLIFATGSRIYTLTNPLEILSGIELIKLDTIDIQFALFGPLPLWSGVFTVFWLLLTMNALNWFDGIPGQVSVLSVIGFLTIGFLSISSRVDQPGLALLAFVLAGISFSCLLFDFPLPNNLPRVLMGDTGAIFFGLMLGVLTIYAGGKVATAFLVLGVPLIDSFLVFARRILKGKHPFEGSLKGEHLHHRLGEIGWSAQKIILLTASLGTAFGMTALFLSTFEKFLAALLLLLIMLWLAWYTRK